MTSLSGATGVDASTALLPSTTLTFSGVNPDLGTLFSIRTNELVESLRNGSEVDVEIPPPPTDWVPYFDPASVSLAILFLLNQSITFLAALDDAGAVLFPVAAFAPDELVGIASIVTTEGEVGCRSRDAG
jgi:hypothetical protein